MTLLRHSRLDSSYDITNQNSNVAAKITAESLLHWKPCKLPLITLKNAAAKVLKAKRHADLCKKRKASFLLELKTRFDISAKDALKIITTNKKLLPADKEEDQNLHLLLLLSPLLSHLSLAADSTVYHSIATKIHQLVHCSLNLFRWFFIPFC